MKLGLSEKATNMIKRAITACSLDAYVIANVPGLTYEDMTPGHYDDWMAVRRYLYLLLTLVSVSRMVEAVDLKYLSNYIVMTCDAELASYDEIDANSFFDNRQQGGHLDTRKRVISVDFSPMDDEDLNRRREQIRYIDLVIRKIIRQLPLPHYMLIITGDTTGFTHPHPDIMMQENPEQFEIFNDLVNDPERDTEKERNQYQYRPVAPQWNDLKPSDSRVQRNRLKDEIHIFEFKAWEERAGLLFLVLLAALAMGALKSFNWYRKYKGE
ncbi:Protein big1 [Scheffersomyces spartinae]|uniref:Protein BIG1 n=1 Tax=Scheffersomyces spartinae TaxID=45513 RepID=A0A9P7VDY7_9ASCO|nr:Protein big1 [Scheffersomyces spartinae]KAG7196206.1 Protein big1 [Scheffersomyces spartinae]